MLVTKLKSKIHGATVTGTDLRYEGSITIDQNLLEAARIVPNEQVHVLNCNTGSRFVTYAIAAQAGSGSVILNGPAARLGMPGDRLIVLAYCQTGDDEARGLTPTVIIISGRDNRAMTGEEP
jgi:aspartate 1-decarboxylase